MGEGRAVASLVILLVAATTVAAFVSQEETAADLAELKSWEELFRRGESSQVRSGIEDYLRDFPDSARARLLLARVFHGRGEPGRAERELARFEGTAQEDPELRLSCVLFEHRLLVEMGRRDEALALLDRALAIDTDHPALLSRKVALLFERGSRDAAKECFRRIPLVSADESSDPALLLEIGRAHLALRLAQPGDRYAVYAEALFRRSGDPRRADALFVLGEIYRLARFEDGVPALRAYHDALEVDPNLVECRVGEARVHLYRGRYDRAADAVAAAKRIRPGVLDVQAVEAELELIDRDFSGGLEIAEAVLAKDSQHKAALACKAAAYVLLSHPDAEAAVEAMRAVDPAEADGMRLIGELLAFHYRFRDSLEWFRRGLEIDPNWGVCYVGLARSLANVGEVDEAVEALQKFRRVDQDRYPLAHNLRKSLQAVQGFVSYPSPPFTFALHPLDAPVLGPLMTELYEEVWPDLCERYRLDPDRDLRVEVFPVHADFSARSVGFAGFGALGVCFGDVYTLVSPRSELRGSFHFQRTAVHELVHVVSLALSNQRVPRWLTEGMSVYEERVFAPYCDREMDQELIDFYHSGEMLPLREFNQVFQGPKILFGYYQGGLLCEFIVEDYGHGALVQLLEAYAADHETPEAVEMVFECSPEALDQRFLDWIWRTRLADLKVQPRYTPEGRRRLRDRIERTEEPDFRDLVQMAWAYHRTLGSHHRVDRDDFIHRAMQVDPHDPSLTFLLGEIAFSKGENDEGRKLYERALAAGGEEFYAFLRLADLAQADGDLDSTLEFLERAKSCFPRFVGPGNPYLRKAQILTAKNRTDEALEELRQYCAIHESDVAPRSMLAAAALEREDWQEAQQYLRELRAIDPFQRQLHRDLARCQRALGHPSDALRSLDLAARVDPATEPGSAGSSPDPEAVAIAQRASLAEIDLERTEIYLDVGDEAAAARALERAKEGGADPAKVAELETRLEEL